MAQGLRCSTFLPNRSQLGTTIEFIRQHAKHADLALIAV